MIEGSGPNSNPDLYLRPINPTLMAQKLIDPMDPEYCLAEQFRKMTCLEWPILEDDLLGLANPIR
jgi:hypothetical protein